MGVRFVIFNKRQHNVFILIIYAHNTVKNGQNQDIFVNSIENR